MLLQNSSIAMPLPYSELRRNEGSMSLSTKETGDASKPGQAPPVSATNKRKTSYIIGAKYGYGRGDPRGRPGPQ